MIHILFPIRPVHQMSPNADELDSMDVKLVTSWIRFRAIMEYQVTECTEKGKCQSQTRLRDITGLEKCSTAFQAKQNLCVQNAILPVQKCDLRY